MLSSEQLLTLDQLNQMATQLSKLPQHQKVLSENVESRSKRRSEVAKRIKGLENEIKANAHEEEKIKQAEPNWLMSLFAFCIPSAADQIKKHNAAAKKLKEKQEMNAMQLAELREDFIQDTANIQVEEKELKKTNDLKAKLESIRLITNPQASLAELIVLLHATVYLFEREYPAGQSSFVRKCLIDIPDKITEIVKAGSVIQEIKQQEGIPLILETGTSSTLKDLVKKMSEDEARHKYFQLYGLVNKMILNPELQMEENHNDHSFFNELCDLLGEVDRVDGVDAGNQYQELNLNDTTETTLVEKEQQAFNEACHELARLNVRLQDEVRDMHIRGVGDSDFEDLAKHSQNVLDTLREANKLNDFDRKFGTAILRSTSELLLGEKNNVKNEASSEAYERYQTYINLVKSGQPSAFKKVIGAMCMFFGALMVAGSIAAKVLTGGLSTPVSNVTLACGIALCVTGFGFFKAGMRKGLSKSLYRIEELSRVAQVRQKLQTHSSGSIFHEFQPVQPVSTVLPSAPIAPVSEQYEDLEPGASPGFTAG